MKLRRDEKGVTLIEVLAAIVILSIVLVSIMNFFPQMGLLNKINGNKAQAINTAKQELIKWQNDVNVQNFLKGDSSASLPAPVDHVQDNYYYFKYKIEGFDVSIRIKNITDFPPDEPNNPKDVRFIQVQLLKNNSIVSETYGYIILK